MGSSGSTQEYMGFLKTDIFDVNYFSLRQILTSLQKRVCTKQQWTSNSRPFLVLETVTATKRTLRIPTSVKAAPVQRQMERHGSTLAETQGRRSKLVAAE